MSPQKKIMPASKECNASKEFQEFDAKSFMSIERKAIPHRAAQIRISDCHEFRTELSEPQRMQQGARCMNCGVPFCQSDYGCPVDNLIPEWNKLIKEGDFQQAYELLRATNNFPEYTGRVCPAPCETACVLGINEPAVTIKDNECFIADFADKAGFMQPRIPKIRTGKKIAIIGSGPAGLAAADQLNQMGHSVEVFEKNDRIGGLLMYGIPNMKLDKALVEKRNRIMSKEGIVFHVNTEVGVHIDPSQLLQDFEAVLLAIGATVPRPLNVPGATFRNVHFAMDFLHDHTKSLLDGKLQNRTNGFASVAKNKNVIVIGGGDTGNDCIGTAIRQSAKSIHNFEIDLKPAINRDHTNESSAWPKFPRLFQIDYGHKEVIEKFNYDPRQYNTLTKKIIGNANGEVTAIESVKIKQQHFAPNNRTITEIANSKKVWPAELVLIATGFLGPEQKLVDAYQLDTDDRSNIKTFSENNFKTNRNKIFTAGDARRGQSLVVWAIREGRLAADSIDQYLKSSNETSK